MTSASDAGFVRGLGFWGAYSLIAGSMIGTGIFFFVSPVAQYLHSPVTILAAWVVGAAIASCGALCVAELAAAYPKTGGVYVYLREAFGPLVGFLYMWAYFLIIRIGNVAILAIAFAAFLSDLLQLEPRAAHAVERPVALAVVAGVSVLNAFGVRTAGNTQIALTVLKLLSLIMIIAIGITFAVGALEPYELEIAAGAQIPVHPLWLAFPAALIPVMWSFGGWDEATYVAEEIRDPERTLPAAVLGGLWTVALLYVGVNAAYLALLTPAEMARSGTHTALLAMRRALGDFAPTLLSVALMVSALGSLNAMTLSGARIGYAAGRENHMLRWAATLNGRTHTPIRSLAIQATLACLAILVFPDPYALLLYTAVAYWLFSALIAGAVVVLRRKTPDLPRPFRTPGYPWIPMTFGAAAVAMGTAAGVGSPLQATTTAGILAFGALAYFWQQRAQR